MSVRWSRRRGVPAVATVDASGGNESVVLTQVPTGDTLVVRRVDSSANTVTVTVASGLTLNGNPSGSATVAAGSEREFLSVDAGYLTVLATSAGGSGGAVSSVVGHVGDVTGTQIAADPALSGTYARKAADWATGVAYAVGELVVTAGTLYRCTTAHTSSGSFAGGNFSALGGGGATVTIDADGTLVVDGTTVEVGTDAEIAAAIAAAVSTSIPASTVTTKGDLIAGTGPGAVVRVPAGADGQIVAYDSTRPGGITAVSPSAGLRYLDRMFPCASGANDLQTAISDGSANSCNVRTVHQIMFPVSEIRLVYGHMINQDNGTDYTNETTVSAAVENAFGAIYQVTFGGLSSAKFRAGGYVISDPIPIEIPYGGTAPRAVSSGSWFDHFWVRTYGTATGSGTRMVGTRASDRSGLNGEGAEYGAGLANKTMSGTITAGMPNANSVRPLMIIGTPKTGARPIVLGYGDSIVYGQGDTATGYAPLGFIGRAFHAVGLPYIKYGLSGQKQPDVRAQSGTTPPSVGAIGLPGKFAQIMWRGATHVITEFGINNFSYDSLTATQMSVASALYWQWLANQQARVWQTTITPFVTTTDAYATLANQTPVAWNAERVAYNTWLRDGAPVDANLAPVAVGTAGARRCPVYDQAGAVVSQASGGTHPMQGGVLEIADVCESSRNSGKFKVTGAANYATSDGVHPSAAMHALMAAALPVAAFT